MEAMNIGAVDARRDPGGWRELPAMSMAAKLKRNSCFLGDGQAMGRMHEQNTGPLGCDGGALQNRPKVPGIDGFAVVHSDDLQPLELDFFVVQDANSGFRDGFQILCAADEFFVIAGY